MEIKPQWPHAPGFAPRIGSSWLLVAAPAWKVVERLWRPGPGSSAQRRRRPGVSFSTTSGPRAIPLTKGDGLGPVFNARSCVECHNQGGPGGGGPIANNVTVYGLATADHARRAPPGVVHQKAVAPEYQERLDQVHKVLPHAAVDSPERAHGPEAAASDRGRRHPAKHARALRRRPDRRDPGRDAGGAAARALDGGPAGRPERRRDGKVRGRVARLADGRIGRFGWKLEFASLNDFVKAACANELGLANPNQPQATPLGHLAYKGKGIDLTDEQCGVMADFIRASPLRRKPCPSDSGTTALARTGREQFQTIGCADCHTETVGPAVGIYSDLLLHDMGIELEASTGYRQLDCNVLIPLPNVPNEKFSASQQPTPAEWRTAPLWGVADSAPYLHDGRAATLEEAIEHHGGEAIDVAARFRALPSDQRAALVTFLKTLRAPLP